MREERFPLRESGPDQYAKGLVQQALRVWYLAILASVAQMDLMAQSVGPDLQVRCAGYQIGIGAACASMVRAACTLPAEQVAMKRHRVQPRRRHDLQGGAAVRGVSE